MKFGISSRKNFNKRKGKWPQMSDAWNVDVELRMINVGGDLKVRALQIQATRTSGNLQKTVSGVNKSTGDPVMRTPIIIGGDKNAIKPDSDVPQEAKFRLSVLSDLDIVEDIIAGSSALKSTSQSDFDALLTFSYTRILNALGPLIEVESEGHAEVWHTPMAGFFTYNEYVPTADCGQEFNSTTCCWVVMKEK